MMMMMCIRNHKQRAIRQSYYYYCKRYKHDLGIVGLPNVGKSTLFNVFVQQQLAEAANYPFCTIEPNTAHVSINDARLNALAKVASSAKTVYTQLKFTDIAGLIKGASDGVGLGNQFLSAIREVEIILHVIKCFDNNNENPIDDIDVVETELCLADLSVVESRLKKQKKLNAKHGMDILESCGELLNDGKFLTSVTWSEDEWTYLRKSFNLLTTKPVVYVCNINDDDDDDNGKYKNIHSIQTHAENRLQYIHHQHQLQTTPCINVCAAIEADLLEFDEHERGEYLTEEQNGLEKVVSEVSSLLNTHVFYTVGKPEAHAWSIPRHCTAVNAADKIHTDISRGFIKAEVIKPNVYIEYNGDEQEMRKNGRIHVEGRDYIVEDGDIMNFKFRKL